MIVLLGSRASVLEAAVIAVSEVIHGPDNL
jgi:hypothetical protein